MIKLSPAIIQAKVSPLPAAVVLILTALVFAAILKQPRQASDLSGGPGEPSELSAPRCVWHRDGCAGDRILAQLELNQQTDQVFRIYSTDWTESEGRETFRHNKCPVDGCEITRQPREAHALIFANSDVIDPNLADERTPEQVWIAYLLESPPNTFDRRFARKHRGRHEFNWTAGYRSDSDIVAPYSKFVPFKNHLDLYEELKRQPRGNLSDLRRFYERSSEKHKQLIGQKSGKVAWLVSNCNALNRRLEYARELAKFHQVDMYGKCGQLTCDKWNQTGCLQMINKKYKFYLAFENSNCREYITEKLYRNAYGYNDLDHLVVPIVMGATREDYAKLAPPGSFIHVDDFESPEELAKYLQLLDQDDALYYSYFRWKTVGHFMDTKFMCRVCSMLHEAHLSSRKSFSHGSIQDWWNNYQDGDNTGEPTSACEEDQ